MSTDVSRGKSAEPFIGGEPKGWKKLWLKAQAERDPKKLIKLLDQLNALLAEQEKRAARRAVQTKIQTRARVRNLAKLMGKRATRAA